VSEEEYNELENNPILITAPIPVQSETIEDPLRKKKLKVFRGDDNQIT
jgi:hypothetical protein